MLKIFVIIPIALLCGCIKDSTTISDTCFINSTNHNIYVEAYLNGNIKTESSFLLTAHETKKVFHLVNRGIGAGMSFGSISHPLDSFTVIFDREYKIAHYKPALTGMNPKRYLYDSDRNLYNDSNYTGSLLVDEKYIRQWEYKYEFTEQDYLDAK